MRRPCRFVGNLKCDNGTSSAPWAGVPARSSRGRRASHLLSVIQRLLLSRWSLACGRDPSAPGSVEGDACVARVISTTGVVSRSPWPPTSPLSWWLRDSLRLISWLVARGHAQPSTAPSPHTRQAVPSDRPAHAPQVPRSRNTVWNREEVRLEVQGSLNPRQDGCKKKDEDLYDATRQRG